MDTYSILISVVTGIVLLGVYKLGYYIGMRDGAEEGARVVLESVIELWNGLNEIANNEKTAIK